MLSPFSIYLEQIQEQLALLLFNQTVRLQVDDVVIQYHIFDTAQPLMITFPPGSEAFSDSDLIENKTPWGYDFFAKRRMNVISFNHIGKGNYFTSNELVIFTEKLGKHLDCFCERIGYGVSRGGFATSMFSKNLRLDRALLLMPISTYDISIASWDPKVREAAQHLNASPDSADCDIPLTIIYDPLYKPDSMHMKRFQSCRVRFPLPGVGHRIPRALLQLGILKSTILQYRQQQIDPASFFLKIRKRRTLSFFYRGLQSCNNTSRFSLRSRVILFHRIQYHINHLDIDPKKIYQQLSESIQKRCFYTTERIFGHGYKNVAGLSALVLC
ncbi:Cytosolic protein, putative [Shewanella piezotolerans WP3]|uniref:Cytosolic protein, putative n=1 Tax=Shewanella piezotolerans (strain WP3 / JCM 13877) TaxID=225849 RepID=B8CTF1_SHEPW|nr:Cytosolic protein, putative [Shewanella piezotolerans]ACJ31060.1 Cytosolic protein, putative [Shewanella piezotolerans WP3]